MHTDLTFFTNEKDSTLLDRFKITLENNTRFFDVLVGYFRTSGFYHLYRSLEKVEKIRILVGINVNKQTHDLLTKTKEQQLTLAFSHKETKDTFADEVAKEIEESEDSSETEIGVQKFIEFIKNGKLEIRAYPSQDIHAKVYIIRKDVSKSEDFGRVITGSSNFSYNFETELYPKIESARNNTNLFGQAKRRYSDKSYRIRRKYPYTADLNSRCIDYIVINKTMKMPNKEWRDIFYLIVPVSYCDYVCIDKRWDNFIKSCGFEHPEIAKIYTQNTLDDFLNDLKSFSK